jgi:glycosyltransferase involved in cell wall biosynthesis
MIMKSLSALSSVGATGRGSGNKVKKIIHLVPRNGIGGVETAVRSMEKVRLDRFDFKVDYITKVIDNVRPWQKWLAFISPLPILGAARRVLSRDTDVLIVSLWRSAIVGIMVKCLRPKIKLVVFIHNATDVHWLDFIFTRIAMNCAVEVWADSNASLRQRFPHLDCKKCKVIPFITRHFEALPTSKAGPNFIFWGRINAQKGLDHALRIFAEVVEQYPDARFWIIGPDDGVLQAIRQLSDSMRLTDNVLFVGAATSAKLEEHALKATFYLQTSLYEGMAMSVVEAMQMGLVPIVTPVGEIPSYCIHNFNALIVEPEKNIVENVRDLLKAENSYQIIRQNAIATWKDAPLYAESILQACEELLVDYGATD